MWSSQIIISRFKSGVYSISMVDTVTNLEKWQVSIVTDMPTLFKHLLQLDLTFTVLSFLYIAVSCWNIGWLVLYCSLYFREDWCGVASQVCRLILYSLLESVFWRKHLNIGTVNCHVIICVRLRKKAQQNVVVIRNYCLKLTILSLILQFVGKILSFL